MSGFDPWTATRNEAELQWLHVQSGMDGDAPDPLDQWFAARAITQQRSEIERGPDFAEGLYAIAECARCGLVIPRWLSHLCVERVRAVENMRVASWDDAFGRPFPKGTQLAAERRRKRSSWRIAQEVTEFVVLNPGAPLDPEWERIGKLVGEGRTRTQELYAQHVKAGKAISAARIREFLGWPKVPTNSRKLARRQPRR
jgi:hypothetical protein